MKRIVLMILAALLLSSCEPYVAKVDGQKVKLSEYKRLKNRRASELKAAGVPVKPEELKKSVLEELIGRKLIVAGAREKGIDVTQAELDQRMGELKAGKSDRDFRKFLRANGFSGVKEARGALREDMIVEKFRFGLAGIEDVTVEMVRAKFEASKPTVETEKVEAAMVEAMTKEKALAAYKAIEKDGYERAKQKLGKSPDIVFIDRRPINPDIFNPVLADALRDAKKGELIPPLRGRGRSWYVIVVYGKTPPVYASFDGIKEQMMFRMIEEEREKRLSAWLSERRGKARIKIRKMLL